MAQDEGQDMRYLWWIAAVFILLALSFIWDIWSETPKVIEHPLTDPKHFSKSPVRDAKLEPFLVKDGYRYSCRDCHQIIEPSAVQKSYFSAHPDIILAHGVNNYCTTCHSQKDKNMLVDINKNDIPFSESHKTCLQCHGPIYRDWEEGVHGRMNDFWDSDKGEVRKLTCVACHDPHQPAFPPMEPAPPPHLKNYRTFLNGLTTKDTGHE